MKIVKILSLSLALAAFTFHSSSLMAGTGIVAAYSDIPVKTIVFKNPAATDLDKFFSTGTIFNFEVYKVGTKEELDKMVASLQKDPAVETVALGKVTGDYQAFTLVLKASKNKAWFSGAFKKAGFAAVKINNNPIVDVDKL